MMNTAWCFNTIEAMKSTKKEPTYMTEMGILFGIRIPIS